MSWLIEGHDGTDVGGGMTRKILSTATHGGLGVSDAIVPPGMFVQPHVHTREDEITQVLAGTLHVVVGDVLIVAPAGSYVVKPRNVSHAFWNAGDAPAHVVELITPGTLDDYFVELWRIASAPSLDEPTRRAAIDAHHARHGIRFDLALGDEYVRRYNIPVRGASATIRTRDRSVGSNQRSYPLRDRTWSK